MYTSQKFLQLISDKQIIYQETFNEYNKKYVIPKTSVLRKNASVDATHGPYAPAGKTVHDDSVGHLQAVQLSRPVSPAKHLAQSGNFLPPSSHGARYDSSMRSIHERPSFYNESTDRRSMMTLSTPFTMRNAGNELFLQRPDTYSRANETFSKGHDSFSRPSSRAHSPWKSLSRLGYNPNISYNERTQLSPNRSSRQLSPQRSPSPSKRVWH